MASPVQKMVSVKLNCSRCGHLFDDKGRQAGTFSQAAGDKIEMPADEAQRNIDAGIASPVLSDKE